jgi:lipopolysaccharide export LptBFGC system permease protein LptF
VFCFAAQNLAKPWAFTRLMRLVSHDLPLRITIDMLPTGIMHEYGDWRVYIGSRDDGGVLHDIVVLQPHEDGQATAFYADEAQLSSGEKGMTLTMRNGHFIMPDKNGMAPRSVFPELQINVPGIEAFDPPNDFKGMTLSKVFSEETRLEEEVERTHAEPVIQALYGMRDELGQRFAFPLMSLCIALAAAPLAGRTRRGGRSFLFASSLGLLMLYFILRSVAQSPELLPLPLMMLIAQVPNIIMIFLGLALMWKVDRV